ncbi:UNVERIFIED_CONTAM: hypothetical protein Scaly_0088300, partial [Sesamum calycinum]
WGWDSERNTITDNPRRLEELYREKPAYKKIVEHGLQRFDLCSQIFSQNTASGGLARSSAGPFFDNIRITKPCFFALLDALTSRGLLPQGQTSRVTSIKEVALFMRTVGMHKRHHDSMERFQHSLKTINRRFHRVLSALCAMAPKLTTHSNFTEPHPRVANNPDFYPYFKGDTQNAKSSNIERSPVGGGEDAPIVISDSTALSVQSHTHIASWDAVEHVACDDGGPRLARSTSLVAQRNLEMGSKVGGIGSWTDCIRHFGMQSDRGAQTYSAGDSTACSCRPSGLPPRLRDGP